VRDQRQVPQSPGERDLGPVELDLLRRQPRVGRRGLGQGEQPAGVHISQALQLHELQPLHQAQQHRCLGQRLRRGKLHRDLRRQQIDRVGQGA